MDEWFHKDSAAPRSIRTSETGVMTPSHHPARQTAANRAPWSVERREGGGGRRFGQLEFVYRLQGPRDKPQGWGLDVTVTQMHDWFIFNARDSSEVTWDFTDGILRSAGRCQQALKLWPLDTAKEPNASDMLCRELAAAHLNPRSAPWAPRNSRHDSRRPCERHNGEPQ